MTTLAFSISSQYKPWAYLAKSVRTGFRWLDDGVLDVERNIYLLDGIIHIRDFIFCVGEESTLVEQRRSNSSYSGGNDIYDSACLTTG